MQVYLLRHGIAEEGKAGTPDAARSLTSEGRRKLRDVLKKAAEADVKPSLILTSAFTRAVQTAEIAAQLLGYSGDLLETKVLEPGSSPEQVWEEIRVHRDEPALLLVGHNPLFGHLAGYLLGLPNLQVDFKKGALMRVDLDHFRGQPGGILRWHLTAKLASN